MTKAPEFPAPFRHAGRLVWDRHAIENFKLALMGLASVERDPTRPIVFVTAKQLATELPYGRRTIGRRIKGREAGPVPAALSAIA